MMNDDIAKDIDSYVKGVISGEIVTGRLERLAVWRYLDDLEHAAERGFYFDPAPAIKAIKFAGLCRQFESPFAGVPLKLRPDQKFIIWNMMGWRQKANGFRRFRHVQYELARKGGKSTLIAYLACLLMLLDSPQEHGVQGYVAATKQEQAKIVWNAAVRMIQQSPALAKRCRIVASQLKIFSLKDGCDDGVFRPLASDKTPDGFNPHFIIKDEEHAWREEHRTQADTLASGFGTRNQPITITITTYGTETSNLWLENHDYSVRCLESVITGEIVDDSWFAFICALDYPRAAPCFRCKGENCPWCGGSGDIPADDPFDEKVWRKANPGIGPGSGFTPQLERMREYATQAMHRPEKRSEFFQKNLNIIVSSREKAVAAATWDACRGELSDWSKATRIHGGLDLGRSNDMAATAVVAAFAEFDDKGEEFTRYEVRSRAWTCRDRHEDAKTAQIQRWIDSGALEESDGDQVRFSEIEDWIHAAGLKHGVRTWAYDASSASGPAQRLQEVFGFEIYPFPQNAFRYNEPLRTLMRLLTEKHIVNGEEVRGLRHDGDPVLAWMIGNLVIRKNARDEWMPDKGSSPQKIDGAVAMLMALSECLFNQETTYWKPEGVRL